MFEYENLYNTKIFWQNLSHKKMEILAAICTMSPPPPPKKKIIQYFSFFLILFNFKKATFLYNFLIYRYSRISIMYIKQMLIYY